MEKELEAIQNEKKNFINELKKELDLDEDLEYYDEENEILEKIRELKDN